MYKIVKTSLATIKEPTGPKINCAEELAEQCKDFADLQQEAFHVFLLNAKNRIISRHLIYLGTLNSCPVIACDVYRAAVREGAAAIVCCHNHPSGELTPSPEDIEVTRTLIKAGEILGIKMHDHIIVGPAGGIDSVMRFV